MEFTQFGKYLLLKKIAVGGMAEIFLAKQASLGGFEKLVVIKRILPEYAKDQEFVRMFLDEARLVASMQHPNVVQVFDLDKVGESIYIAMEYIPGQDLNHLLKACRRAGKLLPPALLARIMAGACEGLHHAHTLKDARGAPLNLVHRDVTPSNLLVAYEGATKVLDFGVAKAESQLSKTAAGRLKGKFPYLAPEQINLQPLDARVDVWSLGVVLWESLTGKRLFHADNELGIVKAILEGPLPRPTEVEPKTPPGLDAVTMRALQRDRDKRYPSAQAMQRDLEALLRGAKRPVTTLEVSAFLKELFQGEYAAYRQLLLEVADATPERLADLVGSTAPNSSPGTGSNGSISGAHSQPGVAVPARRSRAAVAGGAVAALLALAAALFFALRPPAVTSGNLEVGSDPAGATVLLDGLSRVERTPAKLAGLPLGKHEVRVELEGRQPRTATVELTAERPVVSVSLSLPEAVVEPGTLSVLTEPPGANVYLDGARQVPSPVTIPKVAAKVEHTVIADKDGYEVASQKVTLEPGGTQELKLVLSPKTVAEPVATPTTAIVRTPGKAAVKTPGTLELTVNPACDVFVDGRKLGSSPVSAPLPAGESSVQLVNKELGINTWVPVSVAPGPAKTAKTITLGKGKLAADVQPWADVYIGDKKLGTTPLAPREVYEGSYLVRLVNSELGAIKTVNVVVKAGQTAVVRQNLQ